MYTHIYIYIHICIHTHTYRHIIHIALGKKEALNLRYFAPARKNKPLVGWSKYVCISLSLYIYIYIYIYIHIEETNLW